MSLLLLSSYKNNYKEETDKSSSEEKSLSEKLRLESLESESRLGTGSYFTLAFSGWSVGVSSFLGGAAEAFVAALALRTLICSDTSSK